jgi:CRISPR-associated protein Cse1 (CRISPR_cse1)
VATLRSLSGGVSHLRKIVADMRDPGKENLPLFTTRTVTNLSSINVTEAAPWLIHTQAFDPAGTNTGSGRVADQSGNPAHRTQIARFLSVDEPEMKLNRENGTNDPAVGYNVLPQ